MTYLFLRYDELEESKCLDHGHFLSDVRNICGSVFFVCFFLIVIDKFP